MLRWITLTAVATLSLGGCAASPDGMGVTPETPRALGDVVGGGSAVTESVDRAAVGLTSEEQYFLRQAQEVEIRRCMKAAGFDYRMNPVEEQVSTGAFLGPDSVEGGYPLVEANKRPAADPNKDALDGLSSREQDEWRKAFFGDGPTITILLPGDESVSTNLEGCLATAREAIYGSVEAEMASRHVRRQLAGSEASNALLEDREFARAAEAWAHCVADTGFPLSDGAWNGWDEAVRIYHTESPAEAERLVKQLAPTDAACQRSTGIDALRTRLLDERAQTLQKDHGINLGAAVAADREAIARARSIVEGS